MRRPAVLLADDHTAVLEGISRILKDHADVVGMVGDGAALCDSAARLRPDAVVSDVSMPGVSGMEALRRMQQHQPWIRVILLTMHADASLAAEAFRLGAKGFVLKQQSTTELVKALDAVMQGHKYITPALTDEVLTLMATRPDPKAQALTTRQREVLRLIVRGHRMKEIAADLKLSPRTVEAIKYEMMRDLGVQSTAVLVRQAVEQGLVSY